MFWPTHGIFCVAEENNRSERWRRSSRKRGRSAENWFAGLVARVWRTTAVRASARLEFLQTNAAGSSYFASFDPGR